MAKVKERFCLELGNRDGEIMIVKDHKDKCYLVAEADTFCNPEVFEGLGSTEQIEISQEAFDALAEKVK